jgi:hypothetical protein
MDEVSGRSNGKGPRGCVVIILDDDICGFRFFPPPGFLA